MFNRCRFKLVQLLVQMTALRAVPGSMWTPTVVLLALHPVRALSLPFTAASGLVCPRSFDLMPVVYYCPDIPSNAFNTSPEAAQTPSRNALYGIDECALLR